MPKRSSRVCAVWAAAAVLWSIPGARPAHAVPFAGSQAINVGVRAYVNARIHTVDSQSVRPNGADGGTFPYNGAGHLQQNRFFLEVKWQHNLLRSLGEDAPAWIDGLSYQLTYRGEYEGIYDFGPSEFRTHGEYRNSVEEALRRAGASEETIGTNIDRLVSKGRKKIRNVSVDRNRLFQFFLDYEQGPFFLRAGRQNLAWGETDVFRLLDNINPLDSSFGGFFVDLDERRVPLDMLRLSLRLPNIGPIEQPFIEGYVAYDDEVAFDPGSPPGSAFYPPLGPFSGQLPASGRDNARSLNDLRGGLRAVFNVSDFTFTLAHYYTIFDLPAVRLRAARPDEGVPGVTLLAADYYGPRVQVTGASMTTAFPSLRSVLRSELAFFRDEALFRFATVEKFPLPGLTDPGFVALATQVIAGQYDTVSRKNTLNMVVGWDMNQSIPALNPHQTFLFTTQFFYRHIFDRDQLQGLPVPDAMVDGLRVVPVEANQYLQTLNVSTNYNVAIPATNTTLQTTPYFSVFYDWVGAIVFQPGVRFTRDPWRFIVDYTIIDSGVLRGTQVGIVRDRDNVRLQLEYVL